jgi:hypothetical protein
MDWIIEHPQILISLKYIAKLYGAFILGCIGGITLDLIQFKGGLEIPDCYQKREPVNGNVTKSYFDLGFFAELLVGGVAAVVVFCLQPSGGWLHLIAYSLLAGIGGGSLLLSFTNAIRFKEGQITTMIYKNQMSGASIDILQLLSEIDKNEKLRFHPDLTNFSEKFRLIAHRLAEPTKTR